MINKTIISNFQSHEKSELDFVPGINVIQGSSDSGKTSVIRAINWVVNNKPGGDSVIRNGEKECSVIIDDIEKRKGIENLYLKDKEEYRAFGANVPDDISKYFNFSELNMQHQMDAPFLLSNTSGEVARFLNKIVNLDKIDSALKNIESKKRKTKEKIDSNTIDIQETKEQLKQYENLDSVSDFISTLEILDEKLKKMETEQIELSNLIVKTHHSLCESELHFVPDIDIDSLIKENIGIYKLIDENEDLKTCYKNAELNDYQLNKIKILDIDIDSLIVENYLLIKENITLDEIENLYDSVLNVQNRLQVNKSIIKDMEEKFKDLMPEICPLCGSKV